MPANNPSIGTSHDTWQRTGLALMRMLTGALMIFHGCEIFNTATMQEYMQWKVFDGIASPAFMAYAGKFAELLSGVLLFAGLFTRFAALLMAVIMLFICFAVGGGRFYYEDQHPFLFAMLAIVFFFTGPLKWSADQYFERKKRH